MRPLSDVPIAVGALTGLEGIERFGKNIQGGIESSFPVNPIQEGFFTTEIPGVAGQITSMLAGGGAGALGVKALGGTAKAAQLGAKTAVGTQAFAGGTAGGAASADVLGLKGGERIARSLLGGVTELASEAIPFGMGAETGLVRNLLGESVESGAGKILTSGATEAAEEGFAETAGQATDIAFRPEQASMDLSQIGKAMLLGGAGGGLMGAINNIGRPTPPESQTPIQQALAREINAIPTDNVPPQTEEEKRAGAEAGNPIFVDPQGNTAFIAPVQPPPSQVIPKELVVKANETSPDVSSATAAFVDLDEKLRKTQAEGAAADITAAQIKAQEEAAQAQAAAERQAQLEALAPGLPTPQPQVAPAELPAVTPSPAMEMPENLSQTITDSNGEIAPEMSVLPPTVQAGAGVGEAIAEDGQLEPSTSIEDQKEALKDIIALKKGRGQDVAELESKLQSLGADTIPDFVEVNPETPLHPFTSEKPLLPIKVEVSDAGVRSIDSSVKQIEKLRKSLNDKLARASGANKFSIESDIYAADKALQELGRVGREIESYLKPITPQGTPTPATESKVMPGGSAIERDLLKPYANISIPDLEALPESDWGRRRDYLEGKMRNNQQEKSQLLKTPKSNWENREYNENARINDVAASLRAAIQDMQSARPDLEAEFRAKSLTQAESGEAPGGISQTKGKVGPSATNTGRTGAELQQQLETLPSISEQPKITEIAGRSSSDDLLARDTSSNVVASNAQKFAANIRAQFKADELAEKAEKLKEKYYSINASTGKRESESKDRTLQQWKQAEAKAKKAKADAFAELRKQNKGFTVAQLEDREPFMAAKTLEQHGLTKLATDIGYVKQGDLYVFSPQTTAAETPKLDFFSSTLQEAKGEAVESLREAMNSGSGRFKGRNITLLVTPSSRDDVMLQVTRVSNEGEPQGHQDIINEQDFNDELKDQDNLDVVLEHIRPDIGQARTLGAFGIPKFRKPVSFNYRLRLREVGPGTTPAGFISSEGRDVSYDRPLTRREMSDFEMSPVGATPLTAQTTTVAAPTETAAPSAKEAAVASVVQQPVEGSIPTVEQESATTAIESTEKADVAKEAMRFLEADLTDTQRAKWTPEMFTAAQAFFDSGGKDFDSLKKAIKFPRVVQQAYLKADKEAAAEQTRREAADAAMAREVEKAEKEQAKLEADQKQREELGLKTLNSLIEKTRTNVVQGSVKSSDANQAVAILNKSGAIPNVLFTWIGTSKDFLADPANRARYPETWKAVSSNPNIEGMSENGQPIVFTDNVGVSDLDRNLAKLQGTTPEVAAVRRVILHENIHKGMFFLSLKDKMKLFQFLHRLYSPEELDQLAKSYDEYSDWRINQVSYFSIIEEAMTRDFDSMAEIPRDGIWAEFMQFLRDIWQKITGKTSEPTLKNYKDVFRLIRNSLKNSEAANADRLKNGGEVRMSMSEFISNVTPEQDAAYAQAVADGDMETAQRMVDEAARAAGNLYDELTTTKPDAVRGIPSGAVFHISKEPITEFKDEYKTELSSMGFHFGTEDQAKFRGGQYDFRGPKPTVNRVFLKLKNPLRVSHMESYAPDWLADKMVEDGLLDVDEWTDWNEDQYLPTEVERGAYLVAQLKKQGYDGLVYENEKEGAGDSYVTFNPNQIKSADPVTRDDAGNVIPLSRRFQSASNDIRFSKVEYDSPNEAAFNSGAKYETNDTSVRPYASEGYGSQRMEGVSTGDNSPRAQAIRKAVSESNWNELSPTQRAKALEEFGIQSIQSRYSFDAAILPVRVTNERTPKNRPASILSAGPSPAITIQFDTSGLADLLSGDAVTAFANVFDMAQEEVIHAAQHINIYNRWKTSKSTDSVGLYELKHYTSMINELAKIAGDELRSGNPAVANIFTNAWNLYNPNNRAADVNDAIVKIKSAPEAAAFAMELSRMMLQMQRQDFTTETGWMRFVEAMKAMLADITNALRTALAMAKNGQVGKRLQDEISEVNALMNDLESASQPMASKVIYDSPNEAAFNSGAEVARNADYDERDKAVRSTIRAAYDLAPKDNGPSVPLDQLFDIAKQSMPDLTEGEFSQILQDLYEDSGALLQAGESPFIVTTPDGQRAGSAIIVSSLPTGAMASAIDPESASTKEFTENIKAINNGTLKAAFDGVQFVNIKPVDHIVKPNKSYEKIAIDYVDGLMGEGQSIEQIATSIMTPMFFDSVGASNDVKARQALTSEVLRRVTDLNGLSNTRLAAKRLEKLEDLLGSFWQGLGTESGGNQGQRAFIIGSPRYSWMFLKNTVKKELKQRRDNILNVQFGNDNATSFTQNSYENADIASTVSADEVAKDTINDTEWDLIKEGEQVFDGARKTIWERVKFLVARIALYARAEATEIKSASKASFTDAQRDELAAILTMPKAEREKAKAKDLAELDSLMAKLLGEESPTDTPTEKKKRNKRKEIIDTVEKRVKAGEPIEAPDYVPIITENPQRDEIIDDVANSLLQVAKNRGIKPSQKTALADLVASIKSLLKANIKGEDLKADEAPLGQLLARTYLDNLTATEAKLFAQSWNRGRDKVRKMLAETGLEGAALEAELSAIMPATPTIAYNPSAVRKAITRALREATLDANDLLANPQETKAEILKVWDKAAVDAGLSPENWQEGRKLAEKSIDEFIIERKAAKERSKQIAIAVVEQSKNPASLADFSNSLAQFKIKPDKVRELFDQAKLLAKRRVQIANDKAIRVLFEAENKLAQSAFFNSATKPDTIVKAFREQISDPMDRKAFKDRLMAMEVTSEMADKLFDKAAREKDNAQWKRAQDMLEGPNALRNIIREINRARPSGQAPLSKQIPWRELLSQNAKTVEEYRQRIFDAISANEELKSATPDQKARLADLFAEAWEANRTRILDGMQERLIREKEAKGDLSKKGAEALQEQRMRMVEDINLGIFDNDEIAKIMAEKFGIKSEFTDAEREKIESLIEILQDETLNRVKRNKAAYELLETLSAQTDIPISKLLANFWVSSVLSGMNTVFSIGMSVFSGMGELTTTLYRIFVSAFSNPKQLPSEVAAAFKTLARVLSAVPRQANRAWQYLVTGDQAFLDPTMNDALKNMDWDSIGKNTQLAEQMAKSDKTLQKVMGLFMRTVSRLLTALDLFNSGLTKEGSLSLVFRQLNLDPAKIEMLEKKSDLKAYKAQVIEKYFGNVQPKTLNEKALVDSYAMAEMMKELDELGSVSENADQMAMQGAMTLDPSGIGGYGYRFVKSMMKSAESGADKLVERNLRKWDEAQGASDKTEAGVKLALSYIFQFVAYNAANLVGVRFARFAGNKFNQSLSFLPIIGALRLYEAEFDADRIRGKEAFTDMIKRNQLTGVMAAAIGYYVLKAIAEEPDDEKRGWFINGGWSNLTPEKKQQKLASGQKEYTLGFGDTVINYGNWPGSGIIAAIGGLSDLIRFSPDQWSEKTVSNKLMSATASGVFSALEVPALSQFQELFGSSLSSKDPNEQKLTKFARVIGNYAGGFVPRILKDIDYLADPNFRKYETLWEKTASHIPVYRRYEGKEYYDILGQQIQRNIYPGSREFMVKPTDPAYKVLGALNSRGIWLTPANAEHRMVGKGARRRSLTQEEADNYSLETGKGYKQMLLRYGQRALQMPTERAKAFLLDKADDVRDRALKKVYRGYTPAS